MTIDEFLKEMGIQTYRTDLYKRAFTHPSYANEHRLDYNNQRMEFFGDAVLDLAVSEYLVNHTKVAEGDLTKIRAAFVNSDSLYRMGKKIHLDQVLLLGNGEDVNRASPVVDAFEALIAAIYLDKGYEAVMEFLLENFSAELLFALENKQEDYKSQLQENLHQKSITDIEYETVLVEGPAHKRIFTVELLVKGKALSRAKGSSKKRAEQKAAKIALENIRNHH